MYITKEMKEQAKKVDLIGFLLENHPEAIRKLKPGKYVYTKNQSITFYKGKDGEYRYCDHKKRQTEGIDYFGDGMKFLTDFIGGYTFVSASEALLEYDKEHRKRA